MNSLLDGDTEDDLDDRPTGRKYGKDREITLGTTVVLGIFFGLAAYGAVLFGFGYSVGAKHSAAPTAVAATDGTGTTNFNSFSKPAPGSPLGVSDTGIKVAPGPTVTVPDGPVGASTPPVAAKPLPRPVADAATDDAPTAPAPVPTPAPTPRTQPAAAPVLATTTPPAAAPGPSGSFLVQIAAVSHQEDADSIVTTLKRRGYAVAIHHEPQDSFLHVQIGMFPTKKDAEAMRQRLLADGFNAIVK